MSTLNPDLIKSYMHSFYGYGNWKSNFWFVGIEEGGGGEIGNVTRRLDSWNQYKVDLLDNQIHHSNIKLDCFFVKGQLQNTWRKLILTKLSFENKATDRECIRDVQKNDWGHLNSKNLLIELFPLPSPNNTKWFYDKWTGLDVLRYRESYYDYITEERVNYIKNKISEYHPSVILFYGKKMGDNWDKIIGTKASEEILVGKSKIKFIRINNTCYFQSPHPASVYSNKFWIELGVKVRELLES